MVLENLGIYSSVLFDYYYENVISDRDTEQKAMSPQKFRIFLKFSNSLRFLVLIRSATREEICIPGLLY